MSKVESATSYRRELGGNMTKRMTNGGSIVSAISGLIREIAQERLTCGVPEDEI